MRLAISLVTPRVPSKRVADQSPDHPGAKFQQIEDSEDESIAGAAEGVQLQQPCVAVQSNG